MLHFEWFICCSKYARWPRSCVRRWIQLIGNNSIYFWTFLILLYIYFYVLGYNPSFVQYWKRCRWRSKKLFQFITYTKASSLNKFSFKKIYDSLILLPTRYLNSNILQNSYLNSDTYMEIFSHLPYTITGKPVWWDEFGLQVKPSIEKDSKEQQSETVFWGLAINEWRPKNHRLGK